MMRCRFIAILSALFSLMIQGCVGPVETRSESVDNNSPADTEAIKQREEKQYSELLAELKTRNPLTDAQTALSRGEVSLLGYHAGRGGLVIPGFPGLTPQCDVKTLDGMGDAIFGKEHLQYRVALRQYATQYNQVIFPHCKN